MSDLDVEFKQMAEQAEAEERERASRRGTGFTREYEVIKWTGLETGKTKVVRAIGQHPDLRMDGEPKPQDKCDARVVRIASIKTDRGKKMRLILPLKSRNDNHIIWRIIARVNEAEWIPDPEKKEGKIKVFVNKKKHSEIFDIINFNNLPESDPKRKFGLMGRGWIGKDFFVMNVIDRSLMEWHRTNMHTALLSKNVNIKKMDDGKVMEFPDEGVPAFGFVTLIQSALYKYYGYWGKYDIGIERTGLQTNPYRIFNATKNTEQVPSNLQSFVGTGETTAEELAFKTYDIEKLFQNSSYTKLWTNLQKTIAQIDKAFGTSYFEELEKLADQEAAERKEKGNHKEERVEQDEGEEALDETDTTPVRTKMAPTPVVPVKPSTSNTNHPPAWDKLTDKERAMITGTTAPAKEGDPWIITYSGDQKMGKCPDCGNRSPQSFVTCPICSLSFIF